MKELAMVRRLVSILLIFAMILVASLGALAEEYPSLSRGSRDSGDSWAVYSLQMKLKELGYLTGNADGIYGAGTENAVRAYQMDNGLEATGTADSETQQRMYSQAAPEATAGAETEGDIPAVDPSTATSSQVETARVQAYLYMWGFITEEPDGKMGQKTREALTAFMKYAYDGMVEYTRAQRALYTPEPTPEPTPVPQGEMAEIIDVAITPEPTIAVDGQITGEWLRYMENEFDWHVHELRLNDKGQDVLRMQTRLMSLGYLPAGADGSFGGHSEVALKYFQRLNGLEETGVLNVETQEKLFSSTAAKSDKYVTLYKAMVSVTDQRVYIYEWTGTDYTALVHTFVCSTGSMVNPTILGTYQAAGRNGEWYYMEDSKVWVKYAFVIEGGYYFHSVLFNKYDGQPTATSVRNLGKRASHGCIRLSVEDAKWIYENCSNGMTVTIYEDEEE